MSVVDVEPGSRDLGNVESALRSAVRAAADWLIERQKPDGHWVGPAQSNACMEAQWCLALWFLGLEDHPLRPRLARALLDTQRPDGSWQIFHGAPNGDINTTVEAYAALRSMGHRDDEPALRRARAWIADKGGLRNIRVFTRYWLALIGEWPWEKTPNLPPEVVWLPLWFPFSIYNFAQWARATLMPIAVLSARRPSRPLPPENRLDALFPEGRDRFDYDLPRKAGAGAWDVFFRAVDKALHALQTAGGRLGLSLQREAAIRHVLEWIVRHQDADGAWGGIQPPWIYSLMALRVEGYGLDHPVIAKGLAALDDPGWRVDRGAATFIQATNSPVWDTMLTLLAFDDAAMADRHPEAVDKAVQWLLDRQVRVPGDWSVKLPDVAPGGWPFEYANNSYPDTDDTAVALIALAPFRHDPHWRARGIEEAIRRGVDWLIAMQSRCGGWGAFDKDNDRRILTKIPFCDFGEALDPPSVDVTAHVVEAFGKLGVSREHPAVQRALAFLRREQEPDGAWFGRWGVNYVYGTGAVLPALAAIGEDMRQPWIARACDWLVARQQDDGGWGESCESYMDAATAGRGVATASQTAWALMALLAADRPGDREAIERGCLFLVERQTRGTWEEAQYTGTGFPGYGVGQSIRLDDPLLRHRLMQGPELSRAFMLRYDLYRHYFPLMALGRALRARRGAAGTGSTAQAPVSAAVPSGRNG
ncbi:squalene--hopene cyclase [Rhodoplanes sp. TEM]|uniref:Squalene--hopene cyclase n=1 Tax=Rhodoplanes tepidamans TaxID=200616 RepID=A0ABT5J7R5_RHOTP|nr:MULTISPECIES: squalene--hopene cyclase [Rhodoplanes]MDC7785701.1 squalene--hopene cyclase [Rhodoplanes tepidamans]MDC7983342.1 squalene--hopene cyclase [Rhodoplanes sp. TEM]MDQ0354731.1 squalene-hopene/tetraprenyl-beta-curcumene cyclase [Rhodoplanes tepidamans]